MDPACNSTFGVVTANQDSDLLETIQQSENSKEVKHLSSKNIRWSGHRLEVQKVSKIQLRQLTNLANSLQGEERIDDKDLQETLDRMREIFCPLEKYTELDSENSRRNKSLGVWNFALTLGHQDDDEQLRREFEENWATGLKKLLESKKNKDDGNSYQGQPGEPTQLVARDTSQNPKQFDQPWQNQPGQSQDVIEISLEDLVQSIREKVYDDIQSRCGTMRVLDMEQPIGLDDIYTRVNVLEKVSGRRRLDLHDLLQGFDLENFDRLTLGQVRQQRVPGLEAVECYEKLMILGKPGAGKTTFMKRLATLCNQGKLEPQIVPVFVTIKDYAEAPGKPNLQTYIQSQWQACSWQDTDALLKILEQGKAIVLLDGLDEVKEADHDYILHDIKAFTHQFRYCHFVITCRIAAWEYTFEKFTEVELADFDKKQIAEFATKWFTAKQDLVKVETFIYRLEANQPIQELATNPLLLTLLCLVFEEAADFPTNRAELYKEGLDVLLKKWDTKRNIERHQVYKQLSLKRKEDLLSQLAFEAFEQGNYFFKQAIIEQQISHYICNLPGASEDEESLKIDSEVALKSIEAQHGLLVERAKEIYSFSHLTFQEYFSARYIINASTPLNKILENLALHIAEKRYREIFLLTTGMLPKADYLLLLMQKQINQLMIEPPMEEPKLQSFLSWIEQKAISTNAPFKPTAIRACHLSAAICRVLKFDKTQNLECKIDNAIRDHKAFALSLKNLRSIDTFVERILDLNRNLMCAFDQDQNLDRTRILVIKLSRELARLGKKLDNDHSELTGLFHSKNGLEGI